MGRLFEGFQILCTDYDYILGKRGIVFKGGHYVREDIIQGNTVHTHDILFLFYISALSQLTSNFPNSC
jgi:hypothetical protein